MDDHKAWEGHPDYETIKKYANFIDKELDVGSDLEIKKFVKTTVKICEYYKYLEEKGFIQVLPFYDKRPKGLREGVSISLPSYAFKDYLTGNIVTSLSNILDNRNKPNESQIPEKVAVAAIREIIETIKKYFNSDPFFKDLTFVQNSTDSTLDLLTKNGFRYEGINQAFSSKGS